MDAATWFVVFFILLLSFGVWASFDFRTPSIRKPSPPPLNPTLERWQRFVKYAEGEIQLMAAWEEAFDPIAAKTRVGTNRMKHTYAWMQELPPANPMMKWKEYAEGDPSYVSIARQAHEAQFQHNKYDA